MTMRVEPSYVKIKVLGSRISHMTPETNVDFLQYACI